MRKQVSGWLVAAGVVIAFALGGFVYFELPSLIVKDNVFKNDSSTAARAERLDARNDIRTSGVALLTLFGIIVGSVLTWRTVRLTREGQLTDRYAKAVEELAKDEPPAQIGAIYALEGVARSSPRDHWPVVELLAQYLRDRAGSWNPASNDDPTGPRTVSPELDTVAKVLGRRHARWDGSRRLELAGLDLRNVDFSEANLRHANLSDSNLSGAFLERAHLDKARLVNARLLGTHLEGAALCKADLTDAVLDHAPMNKKTQFRGARLTRASFTETARNARGLPDRVTRGSSK